MTEAEFETFLTALAAEGLDAEPLADPVVREYLLWRSEISVAQRMNDVAAEAEVRTKRDPVLAEAIRLLTAASSQADLFRAVDSGRGEPEKPTGR